MTTAHFHSARCGCIGVPLPGVTLKLVPAGPKQEIRVAGPNITPGYHHNPRGDRGRLRRRRLLPHR